MKYVEMTEVTSSLLKSIGYADGDMYVTFNSGKTFMYKNVPYNLYEAALTAPSVGIHFNTFIKGGGYSFVEVTSEPEPSVNELLYQVDTEVELIGDLAPSTEFAAGYDLKSIEAMFIPAGGKVTVKTDVHVGMPDGVCCLVVPRSGLAHRDGITVLNGPGLIDPDYTNGIGVILHNTSDSGYFINIGDKIAQLLFVPFIRPTFKVVTQVTPKGDRTGGFGSTGT